MAETLRPRLGVSITRIADRLFVADATDLYSPNQCHGGGHLHNLTSNLPAGFTRPTSVEFIANNGVNALLVGGLNTPLTCISAPNGCVISSPQSPITVADSDSIGNLSGWRAFGHRLPNALVYQTELQCSCRCAGRLIDRARRMGHYDVTSNFAQATVLQFGLANNDSNPTHRC